MSNFYFVLCKFNEDLYNLSESGFTVSRLNEFAIIKQIPSHEKGNSFSNLVPLFPSFNISEWLIISTYSDMPSFNKFLYRTTNKRHKSEDFKKFEDALKRINFEVNINEIFEKF